MKWSRPGFPCHSPSPRVCSKLCPLSLWCHPNISSSVSSLSSCPQAFPGSVSFPINWIFTSRSQIIGALASASVFPVNIQGWFLLGLTSLISFLSKEFPRVFSSSPGGSDNKESAFNAGDLGSVPGSGRSPEKGNGYPFQYSCLDNSMDWGKYNNIETFTWMFIEALLMKDKW